jgi:hypothetical protein
VKLFGGLLALMLAVGAVSFWAWRAAPVPSPCQDVEVVQSHSPDGRTLAEVYEKRCGDSVSTHVALRNSGSALLSRGDVFIAAGRIPARVLWNSDREAVIESPARHVLVQESSWHNIGVRIRLVR